MIERSRVRVLEGALGEFFLHGQLSMLTPILVSIPSQDEVLNKNSQIYFILS